MKKLSSLAAWMVLLTASPLLGQDTAATTVESSSTESWSPEPGFVSLFNGKDLSGWCFRAKTARRSPQVGEITADFEGKTESDSDVRYSVQDGVITVRFPEERDRLTGQLYTVAEFPEDFVLKLQFRASVNADSGIFIRKPQLQCRDYLVAGPYKELKKYKPQDWNQIEVTVKEGVAHCTCNGEVLEASMKLPETGPIGLEGDLGQMEYRHIQIKKLP
ncbi:3-keto-disaccharide hydrolase [Neorhodopirellula lusitana]|uniref:3-keto-disaccharide hydrolase n=1 Tax=Neorhodopirellula lusitana TaxID=445327 RepID=UPI00384ACF04